ncbi:MAG: ABC transporter permease [Christensenellales bacterium]|jgi:hypothetical protein
MMIRKARRRGRLTKEYMAVIILNGLCIILMIAALLVKSSLIAPMVSQSSAVKWGGGESYAQVSVFLEESSGLGQEDIRLLRSSIDKKLEEASISPASEDARLYVDCYSLIKRDLVVESERMSGRYTAFVVGGDFFTFHPLKLKSGYYFSGSDIMQDRVVLDEEAAWQLFGSYDVAGMKVRIFDQPYIVAGVIEREDDLATNLAYSSGPAIYMSYETYVTMDEGAVITSYEASLPNPISGFALDILSGVISVDEQQMEIVENSSRYGLESMVRVLGALGERSMRTKAVFFPYWENAARLVEERAALLTLLMFLLPVLPAVTLAVIIARLWKGRRWRARDIKDFYERKRDERWIRQRAKADAHRRAQEKKADEDKEQTLVLPSTEYQQEADEDNKNNKAPVRKKKTSWKFGRKKQKL